jgi:hypothetical protein
MEKILSEFTFISVVLRHCSISQVQWLRQLADGLSPLTPGFSPKPFQVESVNKPVLGKVLFHASRSVFGVISLKRYTYGIFHSATYSSLPVPVTARSKA